MTSQVLSGEQAGAHDITYALATSPNFERDGFCVAARSSGLYRSDDRGVTWHAAYAPLNLESPVATTAVVLSPDFVSDHTIFAGVQGGVLRSLNGGRTFRAAVLPSPPPLVSCLAVSPAFTQDGILLAGTLDAGVCRSDNRGTDWAAWNFGLLDLNVLSMAISPGFADDDTLFIGTETGVFRSTNGGRAWRESSLPVGFVPVLSLALSPGFADDGMLFAGTEGAGLWVSCDRGQTWEQRPEPTFTGAVNSIILSPDFPAQPNIVVHLDDQLLTSNDAACSWTELSLPAQQKVACVTVVHSDGACSQLLASLSDGAIVPITKVIL